MPQTLRFHLDENGDPRIAAGLRLHGIDVTTTAEAGLYRKSDDNQLAYDIAQGRVMITADTDFLCIAGSGREHLAIVFYPSHARSIGQVIHSVHLL
jgi:predicted nuclease of predicted toxin-antitoxin system